MKNMVDCVQPCPYGYHQSTIKPCICATATVTKYQKRISGPLLDRIDIHIEVPSVDYKKLSGDRLGETSETIRIRVQAARDIQNKPRPGGGGPPWKNNNTSTQSFGLLPSTNNTTTRTVTGQGNAQGTQILDWRVLILAGVVLSIAFTLISKGFSALKKQKE